MRYVKSLDSYLIALSFIKAMIKTTIGIIALIALFWLMSYIDGKMGMYEKYSISNPIHGGLEK